LAGRGSILAQTATFALAIALQAVAFSIWKLGTRSPGMLVRDVVAGARSRTTLVHGMLVFVAGAIAIMPAQIALAFAERDVTIVAYRIGLELWSVCAALAVEMLIGPARTPAGTRTSRPRSLTALTASALPRCKRLVSRTR